MIEETKKQIFLIFFISLSAFFLYRCAQEPTGGNQSGNQQQQQQQKFTPTYSKDVKPIIDGKCISCHSPGGQAQFVPLTNYQEIVNGTAKGPGCSGTQNKNYVVKGNPNASLLYLKITNPPCGSKMPPGGSLSQDEEETIEKWIENGAPESGTYPTAPQNLQVSALSSSEIQLTWQDSPDEEYYQIKRRKDGETGYSIIQNNLPKNSIHIKIRD